MKERRRENPRSEDSNTGCAVRRLFHKLLIGETPACPSRSTLFPNECHLEVLSYMGLPLAKFARTHQFYPVLLVGHRLSIFAMIRSAVAIASAMADSSAGEGRPSQFTSLRAAKIDAAISNTRLRPSSMLSTGEWNLTQRLRWVTSLTLPYSLFLRLT